MYFYIQIKNKRMVRLKSKFDYTKGRKFNLPLVGKIQFNDENIIEIEDDEVAHKLVKLDMGLQMGLKYADSVSGDQGTSDEKTGSEDTGSKKDDIKITITKEQLRKLNMAELRENCSPFPTEEWAELKNKNQLIDYLFVKLNQ